VRIGDVELPEAPLWTLRTLLGDEKVDEIGRRAFRLSHEYRTVEELACLAEYCRIFAGSRALKEAGRAVNALA
jgi:hypothetical protein